MEPWWSPPSACMGSTMTPVTGHPASPPDTIASSAMARQRSSSAAFSLDNRNIDSLLYMHSPPPGVLLQRVLVAGEVRDGPGGQGHIYLVDVLGVGAGQRGRRAPVEAAVEGEDGEVGGAGGSVHHAALHRLLAEGFPAPHLVIVIITNSLSSLLSLLDNNHLVHVFEVHEFEGVLVGARAAHHGGHLVQPGRCRAQEGVAQLLHPPAARVHAQRGSDV